MADVNVYLVFWIARLTALVAAISEVRSIGEFCAGRQAGSHPSEEGEDNEADRHEEHEGQDDDGTRLVLVAAGPRESIGKGLADGVGSAPRRGGAMESVAQGRHHVIVTVLEVSEVSFEAPAPLVAWKV